MSMALENRVRALEIRCEQLENRCRELEEALTKPQITIEPPPAFLSAKKEPVHLPKKG